MAIKQTKYSKLRILNTATKKTAQPFLSDPLVTAISKREKTQELILHKYILKPGINGLLLKKI